MRTHWNKQIILFSLLVAFISCGKKSSNKKEMDKKGIYQQEAVLRSEFSYEFLENKELEELNCQDRFVESSLTYLNRVKVYTAKKPEETHEFIDNYNKLRNDLHLLLEAWDKNCVESLELKSEKRKYHSDLNFSVNDTQSKSSLLRKLESIKDYNETLKRVLTAAKTGDTPALSDVEKLHWYQQVLYSKERTITQKDLNTFSKRVDQTLDALPVSVKNKSLGEFKLEYEKAIEKKLRRKIQYNRAYFSVPSKVLKGKTQCLGGTKTDLLFNLKYRGAEDYYQKRPVVILSKGHILSGFLVGFEKEWHLFGVESTLAGKAEVYYGDIKNISDLRDRILVLDAFDYLYLNAIQSYLEKPQNAVKKVLEKFAHNYEIKDFHYNVERKRISQASWSKADIFSFGKSSQRAGTYSRKTVSTLNKSEAQKMSVSDVVNSIMQKISKEKMSSALERYKSSLSKLESLSLPKKSVSSRGSSSGGFVYTIPQRVLDEGRDLRYLKNAHYECFEPTGEVWYLNYQESGVAYLERPTIGYVQLDAGQEYFFGRFGYENRVAIIFTQLPRRLKAKSGRMFTTWAKVKTLISPSYDEFRSFGGEAKCRARK